MITNFRFQGTDWFFIILGVTASLSPYTTHSGLFGVLNSVPIFLQSFFTYNIDMPGLEPGTAVMRCSLHYYRVLDFKFVISSDAKRSYINHFAYLCAPSSLCDPGFESRFCTKSL